MKQHNYDSPKSAGWNSAPGFRDSKNQNSRVKPQWRRQQADGARAREWGAPRGAPIPAAPAPWQPPMAAPPSPSNHQGPVAVTLEGLPPALCKQKMLETILEQAGLTDSVTGCILGEQKDTGKALIYLSNSHAAQMCIDHFGGCCWDRAGRSVLAQMVDVPIEQVGKARSPKVNQEAWNNMGNAAPQHPMEAMGGGMIAVPGSPMSTQIPIFMVNEPPWVDFALPSYPMLPKHDMAHSTVEEFYEASTVADGSSNRSSFGNVSHLTSQLSSEGSGNFTYDEGCDTDDGF
jgi:hypothetical protein